MKALILLALCVILTLHLKTFTLTTVPATLSSAATYKSRYSFTTGAGGAVTLNFDLHVSSTTKTITY